MEAKPKVEYSHGHILKFVGCGEGSDREKIKVWCNHCCTTYYHGDDLQAFFTKYATVLWIEFSRGDTNVRMCVSLTYIPYIRKFSR